MTANKKTQMRLISLHNRQSEVLLKMCDETCPKLLELYAELYGQYTLQILAIHGEDMTLQAVFGKEEVVCS